MITVRHRDERGHTRLAWLDSRHTFSFDRYHDPRHMGFRGLRVINEDRVAPGQGFGAHSHRDMEIVTYVLAGALEHRDSLGTGSVIRPGDVQRMSAGTGITHSEYNASTEAAVHFLQIWILPREGGLDPGYEQRSFTMDALRDRWRLVGGEDGRDGAVTVHAPCDLWAAMPSPGVEVRHGLARGRQAWVQLARGEATVNGVPLVAGDGAALDDEPEVVLRAKTAAEALLFDLA
jgi:redox-sensitive bicupin YhaK (pirin superfamily)